MNSNDLTSAEYSAPTIYSDEATLIDLYRRFVRDHDCHEDYLAPSGAPWPSIRIWNGEAYDKGYVNKNDARVNLIIQSPVPPFKLIMGYSVGQEFGQMETDYRIKNRINKAFSTTEETLEEISDVFDKERIDHYRVLMLSVDEFDDIKTRANKLQQSINNSLDQPNRTFGYLTSPDGDGSINRELRFHQDFPADERTWFSTRVE
ncbi:hypothetical protein [Halostagnicola bangensis]